MKTPNPDHPIRKTLKHLALGAVAAVAFAIPLAHADLVSVDLDNGGAQGTVGNPSFGIWSEGANHWNMVGGASTTSALVDSSNTATSITFAVSGSEGSASNWTGGNNDSLVVVAI